MTSRELVEIVEVGVKDTPKLLPQNVLDIRGHGSAKVSNFLNHLCKSIPDCQYLEFGTFTGRSLVAAAYNNAGVYTGVDKLQWLGSSIKFESTTQLKDTLANNLKLIHRGEQVPPYRVLEMDYHNFPTGQMKYDVFFYDADHSYKGTKEGIEMMLPYLKPGILIVDDFITHAKSKEVQEATYETLANSSMRTVAGYRLSHKDGWHTGLYVAVIDLV